MADESQQPDVDQAEDKGATPPNMLIASTPAQPDTNQAEPIVVPPPVITEEHLHDHQWAMEQNRRLPLQDECRRRGFEYPKGSTIAELQRLIKQDIDHKAELERLAALNTPVVSIPEVPVTPPEVEESIASEQIPEDPDTNQVEPPVDPPQVTNKDDDMSHDPTHQPDAGTALADFNTTINGIVSEYEKSTEDVSPAHKAITAIDARFIEFRNSFPNDSYALASAEQAANSAKRTVDSTKSMRQNVRDDEALKAFDPPAPKPAPVKPFTATDIVDDYNNQEVTAEGARKRIDRELTSWIQANPNGDHSAARREAMNVKSEINYLQRERDDAAQRAANDAKRGGGNGGGGNDNGNGGNNAGALAVAFNNNRGLLLGALAIAAALLVGAIIVGFMIRDNNDGTTAASGGSTIDITKVTGSGGGNTNGSTGTGSGGSTAGTISTGSLTTSAGPNGSTITSGAGGVIISAGTKGGGPNLDAIDTGDCEVVQKGADRIWLRSGTLAQCTQTFTNIPADWEMTVDSVYHVVNGNDCTGCTQGFKASDLGGTITVTIKNGGIVLGTRKAANDRYCTAYGEGVAYAHDNAHHPLPLAGWTCK